LLHLGGHCCVIVALNMRARNKYENGDKNDSFYDELEHVFDQFSK